MWRWSAWGEMFLYEYVLYCIAKEKKQKKTLYAEEGETGTRILMGEGPYIMVRRLHDK